MGAYNDDVLFIHVPKCAGWAVKQYMRAVLPDVRMPDEPESKLPIGHIPLRDIEAWIERTLDSFAKIIAVVRNPYEQFLSQWLFHRDRFAKGGDHELDYVAAVHPTLTSWMIDRRADFNLWYECNPALARRIRTPDGRLYHEYGGLWKYWLAIDGEIPKRVTILRQENLATELPAALDGFTVKAASVPHLNTTRHGDAIDYHTPLSIQLTEASCGWAFDNYYERLSERSSI